MSILGTVSKGIVRQPHLMLVYGPDGVGKSTFAAAAPKPIFLDVEGGTSNIDAARITGISTTEQLIQAVRELTNEKHDYQTLILDTVDWTETILHRDICRKHNTTSIELAAGGYGKGYVEAAGWWNGFKDLLNVMRVQRKMNIVLLGHADIAQFNDPNSQTTYDRYQLKMHKKSASLIKEWVDCIFFANFEVHTKKENNKTRAFGDGSRKLYTERRPGYDAKNRRGLPHSFTMSWDDYEKLLEESKPTPENLINQINAMLVEVIDQEKVPLIKDTVEKFKADVPKLLGIVERLRDVIEKQGEK